MPNDTQLNRRFAASDIGAATGLLTRLPIRVDSARATQRGARAAWAWPLAGLAVAVVSAGVASVMVQLGLPASIAAIGLIAVQIVLTGALHEDGLADSLDGLWGGWTRDRRLEIMKDSRIGAYGVIGLIVTLLLRWQLWSLLIAADALWPSAVILATTSRAPMAVLMAWLPPARASGLSQGVGQPDPVTAAAACAVAGLMTLVFWPGALFALLLAIGLTLVAWGRIARAKIGGQTGDILGAVQQFSELAGLLILVALILP